MKTKYLSIMEVAKRIKRSRGRVHQLCMAGIVPYRRLCDLYPEVPLSQRRQIMIAESDLPKLEARNKEFGPIPGRKAKEQAAT